MAELHFTFVKQVINSLAGTAWRSSGDLSLLSFERRDGCRQVMEWRGGDRLVPGEDGAWENGRESGCSLPSGGRVGGCVRCSAGLCLFPSFYLVPYSLDLPLRWGPPNQREESQRKWDKQWAEEGTVAECCTYAEIRWKLTRMVFLI